MKFCNNKLYMCFAVSIVNGSIVNASNTKYNKNQIFCCCDTNANCNDTTDIVNSIHTVQYNNTCRDKENIYNNHLFLERIDIKKPRVNKYKRKIYLDNNIVLNSNSIKIDKWNKTDDNIIEKKQPKIKLLNIKTYLKNPNTKTNNNYLNTIENANKTYDVIQYTKQNNTMNNFYKKSKKYTSRNNNKNDLYIFNNTQDIPRIIVSDNTQNNFYATVTKYNAKNKLCKNSRYNVNTTYDIPKMTIDISKNTTDEFNMTHYNINNKTKSKTTNIPRDYNNNTINITRIRKCDIKPIITQKNLIQDITRNIVNIKQKAIDKNKLKNLIDNVKLKSHTNRLISNITNKNKQKVPLDNTKSKTKIIKLTNINSILNNKTNITNKYIPLNTNQEHYLTRRNNPKYNTNKLKINNVYYNLNNNLHKRDKINNLIKNLQPNGNNNLYNNDNNESDSINISSVDSFLHAPSLSTETIILDNYNVDN